MINAADIYGKEEVKQKTLLKKSFTKSIATSLSATFVDYGVSFLLNEFFYIYYVTATTLGGFCGAAASFFLGRLWVFKKKSDKIKNQLIKFGFTNGISIFLNTSGVYFVKEQFNLPFTASRIIVSILVGFFFNYLMNRYFVFKS